MEMNEELKDMSETDQLTEIYNRRVILEKIEEYTELSKRYGTFFSHDHLRYRSFQISQ